MVARSAPLEVQVHFHPGSEQAGELATHLFHLLHGPVAEWGPRIPVRFGLTDDSGAPVAPVLRAERTLIVVLVDARMARSGTDESAPIARAWAALLEELLREHPPGQDRTCSILPVALDQRALNLSARLSQTSFVRLDGTPRPQLLDFRVVIACLRLLQGQSGSDPTSDPRTLPQPPVEIFVSHAKADLSQRSMEGPVAAILTAHHPFPATPWFDSAGIPEGAAFATEIANAVERASAVVVVLTDAYSSREWCRQEVLLAKAADCPIVVVDAIATRADRLFPYLGNTPVVRWRAALPPPGKGKRGRVKVPETWEEEDADKVLLTTLLEALRYRHEVERLNMIKEKDDRTLGTPPEAITVSAASSPCLLYPDPPLGLEEAEQLTSGRTTTVRLETPLQRLAHHEPAPDLVVALSLSDSPDVRRYGGSGAHLDAMAHDLKLYLLLSGHHLLYGGALGHRPVRGRDVDYVDQLMQLIHRYSAHAKAVGRELAPAENWMAWPMAEELDEDQLNSYSDDGVRLRRLDPPPDLDLVPGSFDPQNYRWQQPYGRYVRSRSLTQMRVATTDAAAARIALGGQLAGFRGVLPGVVEECLFTLRAHKPLYLLGGFGGAARLVADALAGRPRVELSTAYSARAAFEGWHDLVAEYARAGVPVTSPEDAADELRSMAAAGVAAALGNGLSDADNEELLNATDARRAVQLVIHGLHQVTGHDG